MKKPKKNYRNKSFKSLLIFIFVLLSIFSISGLFYIFYISVNDVINNFTSEPISGSYLILGIDTGGKESSGGRTDFILKVSISDDGNISVNNIPRDSIIKYEGEYHKINSINNLYGTEALVDFIENYYDEKINGYIIADFSLVSKITEITGPVKVFLNEPMIYDDFQQDLHIYFPMGLNYLQGEDLLKYVRFRQDGLGDIGRIQRQKDVINQLFNSIISGGYKKILEAVNFFMGNAEVNISFEEILQLGINYLIGNNTISFGNVPYFIDEEDGSLYLTDEVSEEPVERTIIYIVNNIPDYYKIGNFSSIIKGQWDNHDEYINIYTIDNYYPLEEIDSKETYIFLNNEEKKSEILDLFYLSQPYHKPHISEIYKFEDLQKYYNLIDTISKNGYYPVNCDAIILLGTVKS